MTKILFIDPDETAFQIHKCIAQVLSALPPIELFHAADATEALQLLESLKPDVIVFDEDLAEEQRLFLDSLSAIHPPILVQSDRTSGPGKVGPHSVRYVQKGESLDGIHETLRVATSVAARETAPKGLM